MAGPTPPPDEQQVIERAQAQARLYARSPWWARLRSRRERHLRDEARRDYPELIDWPPTIIEKWLDTCEGDTLATLPQWMQAAYHLHHRLWWCWMALLLLIFPFWGGNSLVLDWIRHHVLWIALVTSLPAWPAAVLLRRRVRLLWERRLEAEFSTGRFQVCIACGYDLRGTPGETCPECGASVLLPRVPDDTIDPALLRVPEAIRSATTWDWMMGSTDRSTYAALKPLPRRVAGRWFRAAQREAGRKWSPWQWALGAMWVGLALVLGVVMWTHEPINPLIPALLAGCAVATAGQARSRYRRLNRILGLRIRAELTGGRFPACVRCGRDLTGVAGDVCPTCGTPTLAREWERA